MATSMVEDHPHFAKPPQNNRSPSTNALECVRGHPPPLRGSRGFQALKLRHLSQCPDLARLRNVATACRSISLDVRNASGTLEPSPNREFSPLRSSSCGCRRQSLPRHGHRGGRSTACPEWARSSSRRLLLSQLRSRHHLGAGAPAVKFSQRRHHWGFLESSGGAKKSDQVESFCGLHSSKTNQGEPLRPFCLKGRGAKTVE